MLVKNGFEGIAHFDRHPEMLPHVGGKILFVGECVNLPGHFFADKAAAFKNWYTEPAPKTFDGISEREWRAAKAYCDVRHTVSRSYDKYAKPMEPRLLSELSELYAQIAAETLKRYLNPRHMYSCYGFDMGRMEIIHAANALNRDWRQDARERFLNCSYCTYFQRPNLIDGAFQEIMPREDEFAFEIFCRTLERIKPRVVFVLSAQASASIRRLSGGALPYKIFLFDSACPNEWSAGQLKIFRREVESIFEATAEFHLRNWLAATGAADEYFLTAIGEVLTGFDVRKHTPLENLDRLLETNAKALTAQNPDGTLTPWFNCHPLNICPEKIFPLYLAICRGDERLESVFDKILEQARKIVAAYPEGALLKKNIVLLTDKRDDAIFERYRRRLLKFGRAIHFTFAVISDSQIITV